LIGVIFATALVMLWRFDLVFQWRASEAYTHLATDTRIDSILYGAMLAILIASRSRLLSVATNPAILISSAGVLVLTFAIRGATFRETARYSLQGITLIPLIYAVVFGETYFNIKKLLVTPILMWIGKISYSLYLWHLAVSYFVQSLAKTAPEILITAISITLTFSVASLSYYCIERPFQQLRRKYRDVRQDPDSLATRSL
jgi:peptidoglycan/LPS O-acetylase OafA/YrhL